MEKKDYNEIDWMNDSTNTCIYQTFIQHQTKWKQTNTNDIKTNTQSTYAHTNAYRDVFVYIG